MTAFSWRNPVVIGLAALVAVILAAATFAIVPETQQAVILRFEQPVGIINAYRPNQPFGSTGAGLIARIPFFDRIVWVDKRILDLDLDDTRVLSSDQRPISVDAFARFRIVDPLRTVLTAGSEQGVESQLRPIFNSALRNELGKREFAELLSPERGQVMENIQRGLQSDARKYGVEIVDVRIKRADLPQGSPLTSALDRMKTQRQQQAAMIRAEGLRNAQIVRANAEARAAKIYADAFNKDPDFYDFYRAMQSYRRTFGTDSRAPQGGSTNFVLSPNDAYLRQFYGRGK